MAVAYGEGHKESVLALDFHRKGQYLLSGSIDTSVNLWLLPKNLKANLGSDKPVFLHYPHFSSTEVHANYVDCIRFHGDLIVSRAARNFGKQKESNFILLWKIDGFNSNASPPTSFPIPPSQAVRSDKPVFVPASQESGTRSAWGGRFQLLLQFDLPDSDPWYIRFNLFHEFDRHPVLAAGAGNSKIYFWDLQKLEDAAVLEEDSVLGKMRGLLSAANADSNARASTNSDVTTSTASGKVGKSRKASKAKSNNTTVTSIGDPFRSIKAHKMIKIPNHDFCFRQVNWSRGGDWCVGCGGDGVIAVFRRWENGIPGEPENQHASAEVAREGMTTRGSASRGRKS